MKKSILLFLGLISSSIFSQQVVIQELTEKELTYLSEDIIDWSLGPSKDEKFRKSLLNNKHGYFYELVYEGKVIYSGSINRPIISDRYSIKNRDIVFFCLEYEQFDDKTKLALTETSGIKITTTDVGKKYIWAEKGFFLLHENNDLGIGGDFKIQQSIGSSIKIKYYSFLVKNSKVGAVEELTNEEIQYLSEDITTGFSKKSKEEYFEKSLIKNNYIYYFDVVYGDEIIQRGTINRPVVNDANQVIQRYSPKLCFDYNQFNVETKIALSENRNFKIVNLESGQKYAWSKNGFNLFFPNSGFGSKGNFDIQRSIGDDLKIKYYKFKHIN